MPKFEIDNSRNVLIRSDTSIIIITAYDPSRHAVKVAFTYLNIPGMINALHYIFENEHKIIEHMIKSSKFKGISKESKITYICFNYCGTNLVVSRNDNIMEIRNKLLKASQD